MYLVDLAPLVADADSTADLLERTTELWATMYDRMTVEETLWVFAPNRYASDGCWPVAMAVADYARQNSDLALKNTVTRYATPSAGGDMQNSYEEILFLVKDLRNYKFYKDEVRVEHVYEGKDWTEGRESGQSAYHDAEVRRYNPNGRDPGNVWLTEKREATAGETVDETRPLSRREALRRCVRAGSSEGETVYAYWIDAGFEAVIREEGRKPTVLESRVKPV